MWGKIILSAVTIVMVTVWLAAIWILVINPQTLLAKWQMWWSQSDTRNRENVLIQLWLICPKASKRFLRIWVAENVGSLGSQTDATNLKYILRVRADELEKAATIKWFYGELSEAARPYGGIEGYVQHQFEEARRG
jgi:hypothetical protein